MADRIELRDLRLLVHCGATAEERRQPQPIEVDLDVVADLEVAGGSDELADTVDYGAVCDRVAAVARDGPVALLEALAERLAAAALDSDTRIEAVSVTVRKLRPPVPHQLASAGIRIERRR